MIATLLLFSLVLASHAGKPNREYQNYKKYIVKVTDANFFEIKKNHTSILLLLYDREKDKNNEFEDRFTHMVFALKNQSASNNLFYGIIEYDGNSIIREFLNWTGDIHFLILHDDYVCYGDKSLMVGSAYYFYILSTEGNYEYKLSNEEHDYSDKSKDHKLDLTLYTKYGRGTVVAYFPKPGTIEEKIFRNASCSYFINNIEVLITRHKDKALKYGFKEPKTVQLFKIGENPTLYNGKWDKTELLQWMNQYSFPLLNRFDKNLIPNIKNFKLVLVMTNSSFPTHNTSSPAYFNSKHIKTYSSGLRKLAKKYFHQLKIMFECQNQESGAILCALYQINCHSHTVMAYGLSFDHQVSAIPRIYELYSTNDTINFQSFEQQTQLFIDDQLKEYMISDEIPPGWNQGSVWKLVASTVNVIQEGAMNFLVVYYRTGCPYSKKFLSLFKTFANGYLKQKDRITFAVLNLQRNIIPLFRSEFSPYVVAIDKNKTMISFDTYQYRDIRYRLKRYFNASAEFTEENEEQFANFDQYLKSRPELNNTLWDKDNNYNSTVQAEGVFNYNADPNEKDFFLTDEEERIINQNLDKKEDVNHDEL